MHRVEHLTLLLSC